MFHTVKAKIIAAFLAILAIVVASSIVFGYQTIHEQENSVTDTMGVSAADSCAAVYETFANGGEGPVPGTQEYDDCHKKLRSLCASYGMSYLYVCRYDVGAQTATYLMCAAADDEKDEAFNRKRPYGTVVSGDLSDEELSALAGRQLTQAHVFDNEFGFMLDWYSLVESADGTILGASSYSISDQRERIVGSMTRIVTPFVLALIVLLVVELLVLQRRVFSPLRTIADRMRHFSAEPADEVEPLGIDSRDEMSDIADAFEGMVANIAKYTSDIERMTAERVQTDVELGVAQRIQLGMVPERTDLQGGGFELAAFARPAREVGGDFYDVIDLGDGRVAVAIGDVSGKGMAAALFMAMVKTQVRDALLVLEDPVSALEIANAQLCVSNPEGMFATVFAAVLDSGAGEVRYANAGHVPPLVVGSSVHSLEVDPGTLLGLFEDADIAVGKLSLQAGESLLLSTDGAEEAVNEEGAFLGKDDLAASLAARTPYVSARVLVDAVVAAVDGFAGACEQFDDLTVVALRRTDSLPVRMESFDVVRAEILEKSADADAARKACLACEEAFANIVSHSQASGIWHGVSSDGNALVVTLEDDGIPFDPLAAPPENKPFEELDSGGMGIALMSSIATNVVYRRDAGRNILILRFEQR